MSADDAFLLGIRKHIHHAAIAFGPVPFREAVHQADVDLISPQLPAKTIEVGAGSGGVARPGLGKNGDLIARDMFQSFGHMGMAAVGVSGVKESQALIVAI